MPDGLRIDAYPNPARDVVQFHFTLAQPGTAALDLFDLLGRRVARLSYGNRAAGVHSVVWPTRDVPSGVYVVRLTTPGGVRTQRLTLVR